MKNLISNLHKIMKFKVSHALSNVGDLDDLKAAIRLQPLVNNYLPWSTSAMRPSAVGRVINEIIINKRVQVIEFGSGLSTLYIASILRQIGSNSGFITVEHDLEWIKILQSIIDKENLFDFVSILHAPLELSRYSIGGLPWYSESMIFNSLKNSSFDMAVIDGPLAYTKDLELSRYPALPFLVDNNFLSENHLFILDDGHRAGEKKIIEIWEGKYGYHFKQNLSQGIAISSVGKSFTA